jgi:hypothetical protein
LTASNRQLGRSVRLRESPIVPCARSPMTSPTPIRRHNNGPVRGACTHTRVHASRRVHAPPRPPYAHAHSTYARTHTHTHNHTQPHPSTLSLAHSLKRVCTNPYTTLCWLYGEWGWACAI